MGLLALGLPSQSSQAGERNQGTQPGRTRPGPSSQGGATPPGAEPQQPEVQPVLRVDSNGWPILPATPPAGGSPGDPNGQPIRNPGADPDPGGALPELGSSPALPAATAVSPARAEGLGGLVDVFRFSGTPSSLAELRGARLTLYVRLFDQRGGLLGEQTMTHEADLLDPERDRLVLPGGRVFGRNGAAVFAETGGRPWPGLEHRAARQLELHGLLLRMPWRFGDSHDFVAYAAESADLRGKPVHRVRIERRRNDDDEGALVGPLAETPPVDRYELLCDPMDMRPVQLRYTLAESDTPITVELGRYKKVGGLPLPHLRRFLRKDGTVAMEIEVLNADVFLNLTESAFRPGR